MACNMSPKDSDTVEITERVCGGVGFKGPKKVCVCLYLLLKHTSRECVL